MSETTIQRILWRPWRIALTKPLLTSVGSWTYREGFLVSIETNSSRGIGEFAPLPGYSKTQHSDFTAAKSEFPKLLGVDPQKLWESSLNLSPEANCAVETCLADILAQQSGKSLAYWLAEELGTLKPFADIQVNGLIDSNNPDEAQEIATTLLKAGYKTLKIKVGSSLLKDIQRIKAVRKAVGEDIKIRIDANGSWNPRQAFAIMSLIKRYNIEYCEEALPFKEGKHSTFLRLLHATTKIPLAVDESCQNEDTLNKVIESNAIKITIIKPSTTGLKESLKIIKNAHNSGLRTVVTTTYDSGIGTTLAIHLAAATGEKSAHGLATLDLLSGDLVENPPQIKNGHIAIPKISGIGIKIDVQKLEKYATGNWEEIS